ncbi:hypothetical protein HaLaN_06489 [Haematococcus lacustris]|uniref:Uncharacterized protein n=1 Tax=Haematococcus lacustris TaxID=44745 RepID=A0A699YVJ5_HAELA|nr:hypothetical protein HaLaN_06489 [Haematococcus lacustris]
MHPHGPPALPAANTRHPGTTAQLLSPAPAGMARGPAPGPGGVQLQLQQAFLSQYSTDDQPVRLRELEACRAWLLCCLDSLSSRCALHQLATAAPLLEVGISAAATAALGALLPTSLPDAVVRVAGEVAAQLALGAAAQRLVQQPHDSP